MKKYKLIKWYPSLGQSIKEGDIISNVILKNHISMINNMPSKNMYYTKRGMAISSNEIENNPEFWEEVIGKDYKILQMKNVYGNSYTLFKKEEPSKYEKENHTIHQIKRLSDGEVFTVDDYVNCRDKNGIWFGRIKKIKILKGEIKIYQQQNIDTHIKPYSLNKVKKDKQLLFTTEDGVDIFEGDMYWYSNKEFLLLSTEANINIDYNRDCEVVRFSTKEAAEGYILMNKPCLSINDVKNQMFNLIGEPYYSNVIRKLKEL